MKLNSFFYNYDLFISCVGFVGGDKMNAWCHYNTHIASLQFCMCSLVFLYMDVYV